MTRISIFCHGILLLLAVTATQGRTFQSLKRNRTLHVSIPPGDFTPYDKPWSVKCPAGQTIYRIESIHNNYYEDRKWKFNCRKEAVHTSSCYWTAHFVNDYDQVLDYSCTDGIVSGVSSQHSNYYEDRRFKFYCCRVTESLSDCTSSGYVNKFDKPFTFTLPADSYLQKWYSYHNNYYEDRRWLFTTCKVKSRTAYHGFSDGNDGTV